MNTRQPQLVWNRSMYLSSATSGGFTLCVHDSGVWRVNVNGTNHASGEFEPKTREAFQAAKVSAEDAAADLHEEAISRLRGTAAKEVA